MQGKIMSLEHKHSHQYILRRGKGGKLTLEHKHSHQFIFNCCEKYVSSIPVQLNVLMDSESLLVQSIWCDKALVINST